MAKKFANQLWILFTPHLATSSTVSFQFLSSQFPTCLLNFCDQVVSMTLKIMDSYGNLTLSSSTLLINKEMLKTKFKFLLFRLLSSGFHFQIFFFRSPAPLLRRSPVGPTRRRVRHGFVSQPRRSSPHRPADWRL